MRCRASSPSLSRRNAVLAPGGSGRQSRSALWLVGDQQRRFDAGAYWQPGAFYAVIPYLAMMVPALSLSIYAVGVLLAGAFAFMRDAKSPLSQPATAGAIASAPRRRRSALRYLRGGNAGGCYYPTERTSNARLVLHMLVSTDL